MLVYSYNRAYTNLFMTNGAKDIFRLDRTYTLSRPIPGYGLIHPIYRSRSIVSGSPDLFSSDLQTGGTPCP